MKEINQSLADKSLVIYHMGRNKFNDSEIARLFRINNKTMGAPLERSN